MGTYCHTTVGCACALRAHPPKKNKKQKKNPTISGGVSGVRTHIAPPMSFVEPVLVSFLVHSYRFSTRVLTYLTTPFGGTILVDHPQAFPKRPSIFWIDGRYSQPLSVSSRISA